MKKTLICIMAGVYLFGSFSVAFTEPRNRNPQFQKNNRSGSSGHQPRFQRKSESSTHARKPHVKQRTHSAPQVHNPQATQRSHRTAPRANKPHVAQKHRTAPRVQKHRSVHKHRTSPRVHRPRVWGTYRPSPRVIYPRRHPHGHRVFVLPHGFISLTISGLIYYYAYGNYYRDHSGYYMVVTPPIGALIPVPPPGYRIVYIDSHQYYLSGGVYYIWDNVHRGYRVVPPPEEIYESSEEFSEPVDDSPELFVYPKAGQSENEQANDRYDCHLWAVGETDFDPRLAPSATERKRSDFKRAITACLEARGYSVK